MKILVYAHLFPPGKSGMTISNLEIVKGLHKLGHKIEVIACRSQNSGPYVSGLAFSVHLLPKWPFATMSSRSGRGLFNWIFVPWYFMALRYHIKRFNPDVLIIADETANCFWGVLGRRIKIPYVSFCSVPVRNAFVTISRDSVVRKIRKVIDDQLRTWLVTSYRGAKLILAVSRYTKKELGKVTPEIISKVRIVPRCIDDAFFRASVESQAGDTLRQKLGIIKRNYVLLSVARLSPGKGVDDVINALGGLDERVLENIRYVIVGVGAAAALLKELTTRLHLHRNVLFVNDIPHLDLISYYDMCDLFVLPSHRESFGRVFLEASARAKPCLGANTGGIVDVVEDGKTGFLVPPGDVKAIREKITYMMSHFKCASRLGKSARCKAERDFTSEVVALRIEENLNKAVLGEFL